MTTNSRSHALSEGFKPEAIVKDTQMVNGEQVKTLAPLTVQ